MNWLSNLCRERRGASVPDIPEISVFKHHKFGSGVKVNKSQFEHRQTLRQERLCPFAQAVRNVGVHLDIGFITSISGQ